jgi:hypothetical protein
MADRIGSTDQQLSTGRLIHAVMLGWLAMVGVDFALHAGLLNELYTADSPFLLPLERAFVLIPLGYLSFLIMSAFLVWLLTRLGISDAKNAGTFGLIFGAVVWGALMLGLLSIASADPKLLVAWWIGQTLELGVGGFVAGHVIGGADLLKAWGRVLVIFVLLVAAGILLQNLI